MAPSSENLILAGPVVRRVEPGMASVWLALREPAEPTLSVFAGGRRRMVGSRQTIAVGDRLHVTCVTARADEPLPWGALCEYEIAFGDRELFCPGVVAATEAEARRRLTYRGGPARPSFKLPPAAIDDLQIFFGSCRRIHNSGHGDALPGIDRCVEVSFADGWYSRPDALFLVGDQIYADSLSPLALDMAVELGRELLGWRERLPGLGVFADEVPADARQHVNRSYVDHPEPASVQLYGLGEVCAAYLLSLSDEVWPAELPDGSDGDGVHRRFRDGLIAVRRAMANVSCFFTFDDHEVCDDWNLTWEWCQRVYRRPLGRAMVRNALIAHALFQAWGNDPKQYCDGAAGARLLEAVDGYRGGEPGVDDLLAIPTAESLAGDGGELVRPPGAIDWSVRLETPGYDVVWLDTRTRRRYPGPRQRPELLAPSALDDQLGDLVDPGAGRDAEARPLLVISPAPTTDYALSRLARIAHELYYWIAGGRRHDDDGYRQVYGPDRGDIWRPGTDGLEALLWRLARRRQVVVLSGDTHCAYAVKTSVESLGHDAAIVQLVSSGLCRENVRTLGQHRRGYAFPLPLSRELPDRAHQSPSGWRYRVRYLGATYTGLADETQDGGGEIVGRNNIGELTFSRGDDRLIAQLKLWYRESPGDEIGPRSVFLVPVTPDPIG